MADIVKKGDFGGPGSYGSVILMDGVTSMMPFVDSTDNDTGLPLDALEVILSSDFGGGGGGTTKPPMSWMLVASEG